MKETKLKLMLNTKFDGMYEFKRTIDSKYLEVLCKHCGEIVHVTWSSFFKRNRETYSHRCYECEYNTYMKRLEASSNHGKVELVGKLCKTHRPHTFRYLDCGTQS